MSGRYRDRSGSFLPRRHLHCTKKTLPGPKKDKELKLTHDLYETQTSGSINVSHCQYQSLGVDFLGENIMFQFRFCACKIRTLINHLPVT